MYDNHLQWTVNSPLTESVAVHIAEFGEAGLSARDFVGHILLMYRNACNTASSSEGLFLRRRGNFTQFDPLRFDTLKKTVGTAGVGSTTYSVQLEDCERAALHYLQDLDEFRASANSDVTTAAYAFYQRCWHELCLNNKLQVRAKGRLIDFRVRPCRMDLPVSYLQSTPRSKHF